MAGKFKPPSDADCIRATGCSRAELAEAAPRLPVGTLLLALGLPLDTELGEGFVEDAVEALTEDVHDDSE